MDWKGAGGSCRHGTGRVIALKGGTARWDRNGDSLPKREVGLGNGRDFDPTNGKCVKRFNLQGFLVRPPGALSQGGVRSFADFGTGLRMPVAHL